MDVSGVRRSRIVWGALALSIGCSPRPSDVGDAGAGGSSAADAASGGGAASSSFESQGREEESCPAGLGALACMGWPSTTDGPVWKYTSIQTWQHKKLERTYHAHAPSNAKGPRPLVVVLHGGGAGGAQMLAMAKWDDLGDPRGEAGIGWQKNTPTCKAKPTTGLLPTYETGGGKACSPPVVKYGNTLPYVSVFPDGVMDELAPPSLINRHWEDGRVPSPGFGTNEESRDDVGFIDHVIAQLLADASLEIDPTAIFVTGGSNGGMMTQRLACHRGDARYPALSRVAAFHAYIGELPEGLYEGQFGREACPKSARSPLPIQIVLGTDIDTPQCDVYPCDSPVTPGDGLMPFGDAGGRYTVFSPDRGVVLAGPDTIAFWQTAAAAGEPGTKSDDMVGFFTQRTRITFASSPARVETWVTTGGGHVIGGTRMDFTSVAGGWAFLSQFRRDAAGVVTRVEPTWLSGVY